MESSKEIKVAETETTNLSNATPGTLMAQQGNGAPAQPWQEWVEPITDFLADFPEFLGKFFADYRQPLTTIGIIVAALVTVKVTLALLDAINDIPLLSPLLELIGLVYTGWFVYRYLLRASTRSELLSEFDVLKSQVTGKNS